MTMDRSSPEAMAMARPFDTAEAMAVARRGGGRSYPH